MAERLGFSLYIGISNTTIQNGVDSFIEVYCPELVPNAKGTPNKKPASIEVGLDNPLSNEKEKGVIHSIPTIACQYLGGTNFSVPCVHTGEQVWVLCYEGSDNDFYWLPMGRDPGLRRYERERWFIMDQAKSVKGKNVYETVKDTNGYFIEMNTNPGQKMIHIHTCINDKEPHGYDIRILPEKSTLIIEDTANNFFKLESAIPKWTLKNFMGAEINLDQTDINIIAPHDLNIKVGNDMTVDVGHDRKITIGNDETRSVGNDQKETVGHDVLCNVLNNITRTASTNITDKAGAAFQLGAGTQLAVDAPTAGFSGSAAVNIKGAAVNINGAINFSGALFNVGSAHGNVPSIGVGANAW